MTRGQSLKRNITNHRNNNIMNKKLYIVRGLPGSGKSTFAEALVGSDFLVCEADKYFMVD
jgi:predicted ATPase